MNRDKSFEETSSGWSSYYADISKGMNDAKFAEEFNKYTYTHTWRNAVRIVDIYAGIQNGMKVLDAGCGWGRILLGVVEKYSNLDVTALDFQKDAIAKGEELIGTLRNENRISWQQGDIQRLDIEDNTFDVVYSSRVFQHLNNPEQGIQELLRVTKPGGKILVFIQNKNCPLNINYYSRLYSPGEVKKWFDSKNLLDLKVRSMDFYPSQLVFSKSGKSALGIESFLERVPLLNQFGGKVLATATKA